MGAVKKWTEEEDLFLKENYGKISVKELSDIFNCNKRQILYRLKKYNIKLYERYKDWEKEVIKNNPHLKNKEIQEKYLPHRTIRSIGTQFNEIKLKKIRGRQWTNDEVELFIKLYPDNSWEDLAKIFKDLTKSECMWMREKYQLKQSKERELKRRTENGRKTELYFSQEKEEYVKELLKTFNNIEDVCYKFIKKYPMHNNFKCILNWVCRLGLLSEENYFKYKRVKNKQINLNEAFSIYKKILQYPFAKSILFNKEQTKFLFKYWMKVNSITFSKSDLMNCKNFRSIFEKSKLDHSIGINFKYYYEFIQYLFPNYRILPWELGIQVPNHFWDNYNNKYHMLKNGIDNLFNDYIIKCENEIFSLSIDVIEAYFNTVALRKDGYKKTLYNHLLKRDIYIDLKAVKIVDDQKFDSFEEIYIYNFLKSLNFNIKKNKKIKYRNTDFKESYIPDFTIEIDGKTIIIEYYGLYLYKINSSYIIDKYIEKTHRKNDYYCKNLKYFIDLYPEDLKNNFEGVRNKLALFFIKNFDVAI